jgi:hypothetical protein
MVLVLTVLVVVPIAAVAFARSGKGLEELGKGRFAIDRDDDLGTGMTASDTDSASERERADEVRQMIEAADFRSRARGDGRLDVEREIERLLGEEVMEQAPGPDAAPPVPDSGDADSGVRAEVRQLVVANNERRARRGEEPLDVESEVERRMKEWG